MKFQILKKYFGYDSFRPGQEAVIDSILSGRDAFAVMPTGAGKSLCYQVPALIHQGITLVISPLISLMKDQVQALNQAGVHAAFINSSLTESQIAKALQYAAAGRYKIIYVAPERLETEEFMQFARQTPISMLTVDEAHCISQWGQDFRPSYLKIVQFIHCLPIRPIISAFTATATETVREDILCVLGLENPQVSVTGFDRENLFFGVETPKKKDDFLLRYLSNHEGESGIIYCATRKNVDNLYDLLLHNGFKVTRYHAGLGGEERKRNQDDFIYDTAPIVVATNAFGMGIDKSNVRYVLHYNMPGSLENYYQEAGRAGRDGEPGECILLYSAQDVVISRFLLDNKESREPAAEAEAEAVRERDEERLRAMTYYCTGTGCLREYILRYFGETGAGPCGKCSNCLNEYEETDMTEAARDIIGCIMECRQRYGVNVITGTVVGSTSAKLKAYGVDTLSSYASLSAMTELKVKQIINQMLTDGILYLTNDKYTLLKLSDQAREVYQGRRRVMLKLPKQSRYQEQSQPGQPRKAAGSLRKSDILTSAGLELFDKLREMRSIIAREEAMPPYIIFSDRTLVDMCVKLPDSKAAMLRVTGVGEHKFDKYGERFLVRIRECTEGKREKYFFGGQEEASRAVSGGAEPKSRTYRGVKEEYRLTPMMASEIIYTDKCLLGDLVNQLNDLRDSNVMKKISAAAIIRSLADKQYVAEQFMNGMWKKVITDKGLEAGMATGVRISAKGQEYEDLYYNEKAQRMIVELLLS